MFPIDVFVTLQRKYLRLTTSSSFCSDLVDLPTSLELLRSIYMNSTVAPSRELKISSHSFTRCPSLELKSWEYPVMKKIQIRDRKGFVSQSGKLQALDLLLKTTTTTEKTSSSSSVVVLVEDNETLEMLDEYVVFEREAREFLIISHFHVWITSEENITHLYHSKNRRSNTGT